MVGDCDCGAPCCYADAQESLGKCWGEVIAEDEQYDDEGHWFVHACRGHAGLVHGQEYEQKPK